MQITKGIIQTAQKVVLYGPEGIGKSTFASKFPSPVFIDTEGSTNHMDVARFPRPTSWTMLMQAVDAVISDPSICGTLVIDTADWAESLCISSICATYKKTSIEDFGYGKGYTLLSEEFGRLLNKLDQVIERGVHVLMTAHAKMRKFEQPDEMGAYDRWEMKLSRQVAPPVKEWADMVLFANYKTFAVSADDKGKKFKGQGGRRVMYTSHHPCWDAKNRHNLAEELPLDFSEISAALGGVLKNTPAVTASRSTREGTSQSEASKLPAQESPPKAVAEPITSPTHAEALTGEPPAKDVPIPDLVTPSDLPPTAQWEQYDGIPKPLLDLMNEADVTPSEIQLIVADKGYYPADTPIANYDPAFIEGWIMTVWAQLVDAIRKNRIPF